MSTITSEVSNIKVVDESTGELLSDKTQATARKFTSKKEDEFIKVFKYANTVFAYKGVPLVLVPTAIEIARHMSSAEEGQEVYLYRGLKDRICAVLDIKLSRLDKVVMQLVEHDILRKKPKLDTENKPMLDSKGKVKYHRGIYAVNPFVFAQGKPAKIEELRLHFDFIAEKAIMEMKQNNLITGETIELAVKEEKVKSKQLKGQISMLDEGAS